MNKNKANKELKIWSQILRKRIYDMRSATPGNQEQIIIERPQQGRFEIVIIAIQHAPLGKQQNIFGQN